MSIRSLLAILAAATVYADTGRDAWLRYAPRAYPHNVPAVLTTIGNSPVVGSARQELLRGIRGMLGRTLRTPSRVPEEDAILLGTLADLRQTLPLPDLPVDAYLLRTVRVGSAHHLIVTAANDRGVLYGAFALLRKIDLGQSIENLDETQTPSAPVRWVNQWDNLDGTIERGYGGRSIFWDNLNAREDLSRAGEYARLLASLGINGCSINNVNANPRALVSDFLPQVARIAAAFRPWGVRAVLAVDFGSPKSVGGFDTFDPLNPRVAAWWKAKADEIYRLIPDLGGFVLKADSEGRVGPSAYQRTHADAANVVARALQPHGGRLFYRAFVYDHHMDWLNPKNDRARAAYDNFAPLDGRFDSNVVLQIKHGPIDFQVREPVSPILLALHRTDQAIELQITQEYFGQARHSVFLVPMWKEALHDASAAVRLQGLVGVANVGLDDNWLGNHLSQANLFGFGRLAWNPALSARQIVEEWTRLTFGGDSKVLQTIVPMLLGSWRTYENYTGPLGLQTLTDIKGNHFGPAVEASERNGWGQWHRADQRGVGMDRTVAAGTGFIGQYPPQVAQLYESLSTCPDDLLLFMHHVPYTHLLHSGKTVIQYLYDSHYAGAERVSGYVTEWKRLQGHIDGRRFADVLAQLDYQAGAAELWRDAINDWFAHESGVADAHGRVGHHPGRIEAEQMRLDGYSVLDVAPWEAASGGKAIECPPEHRCTAGFQYRGAPGWHNLNVRYFDQSTGVAHFRLRVAGQLIDEWSAADHFPSKKIDGGSSTRRLIPGVALRTGDEIRIEGIPDAEDRAALDYMEIR